MTSVATMQEQLQEVCTMSKNKNKASTFTKLFSPRQEVSSAVYADDHRESIRGFLETLKSLRSLKDKRTFKKETFEDAMRRMGVNESNLSDSYRYQKAVFFCWFTLGLIATAMALLTPFFKNFLVLGPCIGFVALAYGQCYRASYHCYCINHRKLAGIDRWRLSREFFPKQFISKK
jgi:hypothetical protein